MQKNPNEQTKKVVIIGAGLGGMAAACRLAKLGYQVDVFEQSSNYGGKAGSWHQDGYRWDSGPSFLTMIWVFEELFDFCDQNLKDYVNIQELDETGRYFWQDGTTVTTYFDLNKTKKQLVSKLKENPRQVDKYFQTIQKFTELTSRPILEKSFSLKTLFTLDFLWRAFQIASLLPFKNLDNLHRTFFSNPKSIQLFNRYATYIHSNPSQLPSLLGSVADIEQRQGLYFASGGIISISTAIYNLAIKLGVKFTFNTKVQKIVPKAKKSDTGSNFQLILPNNHLVETDILVSNLDIKTTYQKLLNKQLPFKTKPESGSYLVFYWGIKRQFPQLLLHNTFMPKSENLEYSQIFDYGKVPDEPMIYLNITCKQNPTDAPNGCENWTVILIVPSDDPSIDWAEQTFRLKKYVLSQLGQQLKTEIEPLINSEKIITPVDIQRLTGSMNGAICGDRIQNLGDTLTRARVKSKDIENLYFVGGSVNPGCGMPLVLLSAKHCIEAIQK